ncbi:hypothetical protein Tco_0471068 [Tanacetum coccineum]
MAEEVGVETVKEASIMEGEKEDGLGGDGFVVDSGRSPSTSSKDGEDGGVENKSSMESRLIVTDEVFKHWMAFGGNTTDWCFHLEKNDKITTSQNRESVKIMHTDRGETGVAIRRVLFLRELKRQKEAKNDKKPTRNGKKTKRKEQDKEISPEITSRITVHSQTSSQRKE